MLKQYLINEKKHWKLAEKQVTRHPKWKRQRVMRWIMLLLCIGAPIAGAFIGFHIGVEPGPDGVVDNSNRLFGSLFMILAFGIFPWMIGGVYLMRLKSICYAGTKTRLQESLCLTDDGIVDLYQPLKDRDNRTFRTQEQLPYKDMVKLVYNEYHERFTVYGKLIVEKYYDYPKPESPAHEGFSAESGANARYYAYYENFEDFMNTVSEKSGLPIEHINYSEE